MRTIKSLQRAHQRPDTRADIRDRLMRQIASARAIEARSKRFQRLTYDNADEAIAYQENCYTKFYRALVEGRVTVDLNTGEWFDVQEDETPAQREMGRMNAAARRLGH